METLVAFTSAKTLSPGIRCIAWTERVVIIDAISPMLVSTITSLVTLSDTMLFTVPGSWFRMLSSIRAEDSPNETDVSDSPRSTVCGYSAMHRKQLTIDKFPNDARWRAGELQVVMIVV
jgi:hypothetical protein